MKKTWLLVPFLVLGVGTSRANPITYTFSAPVLELTTFSPPLSAVVTTGSFITSETTFTPPVNSSCYGCVSITFIPNAFAAGVGPVGDSAIEFTPTDAVDASLTMVNPGGMAPGSKFYFEYPGGTFTKEGSSTYEFVINGKIYDEGTLTVTYVPEPSSLLLMATGLAGLAGMYFRRRRV